MPYKRYKDKKKRRTYLRNYMQDYRIRQKELRQALKQNEKALEQLKKIPNAYELIFGKKKKKR